MDSPHLSKLDTLRFGYKIAKVNNFGANPEAIVSDIRNSGVKLIISKINLSELTLINQLESLGFRIKDSQVTYVYKLERFNPALAEILNSPVNIRKFRTEDLNAVQDILLDSFNNYGHYFADEKLDKQKCLDLYVDWGTRSCIEPGVADAVFVAEVNGSVAGLLSFKIYNDADKVYAAGGLGAVSSTFRGNDMFKKLAVQGLVWGIENKLDWVEHNVLTTNWPVNGAFSSTGFKISNSFITMHCWL